MGPIPKSYYSQQKDMYIHAWGGRNCVILIPQPMEMIRRHGNEEGDKTEEEEEQQEISLYVSYGRGS